MASPEVPALAEAWRITYEVSRFRKAPRAIEQLAARVGQVGFEVVRREGFFAVLPSETLDIHAATLGAVRRAAAEFGIATAAEVNEVLADIEAAKGQDLDFVTSPFVLALILRRTD